jgi:hypothetical protein
VNRIIQKSWLRICGALPLHPVYPFLLLCLDVGAINQVCQEHGHCKDTEHFSDLNVSVVLNVMVFGEVDKC